MPNIKNRITFLKSVIKYEQTKFFLSNKSVTLMDMTVIRI